MKYVIQDPATGSVWVAKQSWSKNPDDAKPFDTVGDAFGVLRSLDVVVHEGEEGKWIVQASLAVQEKALRDWRVDAPLPAAPKSKYSLEKVYEIWNDKSGEHLAVGPDRDGMELTELRSYCDTCGPHPDVVISITDEQLPLLIEALTAVYNEKKGAKT